MMGCWTAISSILAIVVVVVVVDMVFVRNVARLEDGVALREERYTVHIPAIDSMYFSGKIGNLGMSALGTPNRQPRYGTAYMMVRVEKL